MKLFSLVTLLLTTTVIAAPSSVEKRQTDSDDTHKTIQISKVDWQRSSSTINGIRFHASIAGTSLSWRCTSDSSSLSSEGFAPLKVDRCAKGAPITFAYDTTDGSHLRMWYTEEGTKSYLGSAAVTPGKTEDFSMSLVEILTSPTSTPEISA